MSRLPNPVIVVPGIIATYLRDEYTLPPEDVWTVLTKDYDRTGLHPDDLRYENTEPARIRPTQIYEIAYRELIEELRHNLTMKADQPVPVYPFGYDWRKPLDETELRLSDFIDEVIDRTKLLRHYDADGYADNPCVNLVGHSMGGLVIAGCLQRLAGNSKVGKVATLAAPFRGSFEAVIKIATGTSNLGGEVPSSREREAARLTPAVYHLFPSMPDTVGGKLAIDIDRALGSSTLFDSATVQQSVLDTLAEFIRLHGLNRTGRDTQARALLNSMLTKAKAHRDRIESFKLSDAKLSPGDWLAVVGVGCTTRVRMRVIASGSGPIYDLNSDDRLDEWKPGIPPEGFDPSAEANRTLTGDTTVPFSGAIPGCLKVENLGYWELQDRTTANLAGFHGILPNMNMLHRLIATHFKRKTKDQSDKYGNIWGRPAPGVTEKAWDPALPNLQAKATR